MFGVTVGFALVMPILYLCRVNVTRLYYGTDTRIYSLFAGMLLGWIYTKGEATKNEFLYLNWVAWSVCDFMLYF